MRVPAYGLGGQAREVEERLRHLAAADRRVAAVQLGVGLLHDAGPQLLARATGERQARICGAQW